MSEIRIIRDVLTQDEFDKRNVYTPHKITIKKQLSFYLKKRIRTWTLLNFLKSIFPIFGWLPDYRLHYITTDVIAGSTVAILNIPQAMAYAVLAGVPTIIGLYTSFLPAILYMFFGTSKHISLGMFAVVALMTGNVEQDLRGTVAVNSTGTGHLADNESVQIIATLTFAVGLVLAAMALLQVHFVSAYLSDELIGGFTTGAAWHVVWSQIPKIFQLKLPRRSGLFVLFQIMIDFFKHIKDTNFWALGISGCCVVFLYTGKTYINPFVNKYLAVPIPFELIVVIVTTVLSNVFKFKSDHGVAVVGKIPTGLPLPVLPKMSRLGDVIGDAVIIAIVIYAVSFSVAKLFAKKHGYKLDAAQEVRALSAVQLISSFMLCHPASASLSRSTVNSQLGVHSQISGLVSSSIMLLLILWIGPLVENLPMCVLASIILVALQSMLMQIFQLKPLWNTSKYDFSIWLVSFLGTVLWDVSEGLIIAILFSLLTIVIRTQIPKTTTLGQVSDTEIFKNTKNYGLSFESPIVTVFRFEAPLLFVNCDRFKDRAQKAKTLNSDKRFFIVDAGPIADIDKMGANTLKELAVEFAKTKVQLLIACANDPFLDSCHKFAVYEQVSANNFFVTVNDAVIHVTYIHNAINTVV